MDAIQIVTQEGWPFAAALLAGAAAAALWPWALTMFDRTPPADS